MNWGKGKREREIELRGKKIEDLLGEILGGFKVQRVLGSHQKERNREKKWCHTLICSCEGEGKKLKKKKSKDKDKQWSHMMGKKAQGENAKKYGDDKNGWKGIVRFLRLRFYVFRILICNVSKPWSKQCI